MNQLGATLNSRWSSFSLIFRTRPCNACFIHLILDLVVGPPIPCKGSLDGLVASPLPSAIGSQALHLWNHNNRIFAFWLLTVEDNMLMNLIFFSKSLVVLKHGLIFCLRELMVCFAIQCKILPWMENMPAKFVKLWMLISLFFKYSNFIWFSCRNLNIF